MGKSRATSFSQSRVTRQGSGSRVKGQGPRVKGEGHGSNVRVKDKVLLKF